jgi:diguanylate cyclase (GGDEF)-like protein
LLTSAPLPTDDLEALGTAIVVRLRELVPTVWAGCFVYGERGTARAVAADGLAPASLMRLRVAASELPDGATVVPLQRGSARIGFLAAGERLDGSQLSKLDRDTIGTLAAFVAAEVDAAVLRSRADDESQFRAGVTALAHDLAAAPTSMDVLTVTLAHVARLLRAQGVSLWRQTDTGWNTVIDNQSSDGAPVADVLDEVLRQGLPEDVEHAWVVANSEARMLAFGMGGVKQPRQLWIATRVRDERPFGPRAERRAREIAEHASAAFQRAVERESLEAQLRQEAFYDSLTGLPNRALFLDRLDRALARAARSSHQLAVLFIDVDRFKVINDSLGHGAGDQLLVQVGARLRDSVRGSDTVARLGGDEFTVLLEGPTALAEAERAADRMLGALQAPFVIEGQPTYVSASIGIAGSDAFEQARDLMREADIALYRAKAAGRGRATMYEPDMGGLPAERLHLESDLHRALENGEFILHYQPIFAVRDASIVGLEALVRWRNPSKGLVPPSEFIPLAEDNGLIVPIGAWVLDEACRQMRAWQDEFAWLESAKISVNLSAQQFLEPGLIERIERALRRSQLDARCLQLEITESAVMHDAESTIEKLRALKALGISLAVDDFGTGYSSLAYLKRFPIDMLKIDRSFVVGLTDGGPDTAIAQSVVGLARALGMATTAEGIEDKAQWQVLQGLGYDNGQGYVYSRPLPVDDVRRLLETESNGYRSDAAA